MFWISAIFLYRPPRTTLLLPPGFVVFHPYGSSCTTDVACGDNGCRPAKEAARIDVQMAGSSMQQQALKDVPFLCAPQA